MSKYFLSKLLMFTSGAIVGSIVTWKVVSAKYDILVQEEINSVKESLGYFDRSEKESVESEEDGEKEEPTEEPASDAREEIKRIVSEQGYDYTAYSKKEEGADEDMANKPYVISPEEFGELDYKIKSLTYYNDGVLVTEMGKVIHDVDKLVGKESLDTFGQYEDDSVFVRNDRIKTDFEILADERNYNDTI